MNMEKNTNFSFLLRLWQISPDLETGWLVSLEDPLTGERKGFASLDAFFQYLKRMTEPDPKEQNDQNLGG